MLCEICKDLACYCSSHWLMAGGMMVLYWCPSHAPLGAEFFNDPSSIKKEELITEVCRVVKHVYVEGVCCECGKNEFPLGGSPANEGEYE